MGFSGEGRLRAVVEVPADRFAREIVGILAVCAARSRRLNGKPLGGSYQSLPRLDYRDTRPEPAMSEQMQEQPADDCQQSRWFTLPRISPTDWDQVHVSQLPPGTDIHGEANFVMRLRPATSSHLLDAGCGTGRVGIELARRRADVVGVDLDPDMLAVARSNAPALDWRLGDLATIRLEQTFDIVLLAGNVLVVVASGTEAAIVANMAQHLVPGGLLIAGFRTDRDYFTVADYDAATAAVGLSLIERWATWECASWTVDAPFAVSVHQRPYDEIELPQTEERSH